MAAPSTAEDKPKAKRNFTPAQLRAQADFGARMKAAWADKHKAEAPAKPVVPSATAASPPVPKARSAPAPTTTGSSDHGKAPSGPAPGLPVKKVWYDAVGLGSLLGGKRRA